MVRLVVVLINCHASSVVSSPLYVECTNKAEAALNNKEYLCERHVTEILRYILYLGLGD